MAPYLRDFIQRQVETIRTALRMYGVQGVKPVQDALQKVAGAYKTQEKPLAQAYEAAKSPAKGLFERASGVVDRVAKVSDSLCKIKKVGEEAIAVGSAESALVLPYASKFLSGS